MSNLEELEEILARGSSGACSEKQRHYWDELGKLIAAYLLEHPDFTDSADGNEVPYFRISYEDEGVYINKQFFRLTLSEFHVVQLLFKNKKKPLTIVEICESVKKRSDKSTIKAMYVTIASIRDKIGEEKFNPKILVSRQEAVGKVVEYWLNVDGKKV